MIEKKLNELAEENGGSIIIILKGFDTKSLQKAKKYFTFEIDYLDIVDLKSLKKQVVNDIYNNRSFDENYRWMTMEEYELFKPHSDFSDAKIIALENDLYDKLFPYRNTLSNVENIYHRLYYQEDNELNSEEKGMHENVSTFYGSIEYSKISNNYFVTYHELEKEVTVSKYFNFPEYKYTLSDHYPVENVHQIELSEDELPFLDLTANILSENNKLDVIFVLSSSSEALPNNYLSRIEILNSLSNANFYFTTLTIQRKVIHNKSDYLEILRNIYGYNDFRSIEFYKNIESKSRETVEISQAQIIDDIISQAEKAMQGDDFRDVYITAFTGAGKSIMFQIPALYLAKKHANAKPLTLVISPLIGLMKDQVHDMKSKGINNSATINGNTPPYEKEKTLEGVKKERIDVLYLSPESLQARSDIKMLIGDRNIGVVIIDEAHIVTTWGKSFRADYWYLGIYLSKLRKEYKFPIVTFTATAIYGGREDMYLDTRNSLNMISPISYFGVVRRDEIYMKINSSDKVVAEYRKIKVTLALQHLKMAYRKKEKSLMYFPTVKLLIDFFNVVSRNEPAIAKKTGKYYGTLQKEEKDAVLEQYKSGELQFVLATKAFGMGIDIPDIKNVYHYAPTGNVVDYIQEIGRSARNRELVSDRCGFGNIDFLSHDLNEVKQLYGMSAIRKTQILEVMRKIVSVYKEKNCNRNLIISSDDFKYIFVNKKGDEDSLDNKVKTVLLMIEKDFSSPNKLGYSPFVARPRSLYGNDYLFVTPELEIKFIRSHLGSFFEKKHEITSKSYSAIYRVNLSGIWEKHYKTMTFPSFKYALFTAEEREKLQHKSLFNKFNYCTGVDVRLNDGFSVGKVISEYKKILASFESFLNQQRIIEHQFTVEELGNHFRKTLKISDKFTSRAFAQTLINASFEFTKIKEVKFISERANSRVEKPRYIVHQDGDIFTKFIMQSINDCLIPQDNFLNNDNNITSFHVRSRVNEIVDSKISALGIGEARKLLNYQITGGDNPQIYLRINSIYPLEKTINQGDFYQNNILKDVQIKHYTSVEMLKYLFKKEQPESIPKERILNYSNWFWNNIENYFMGIIPTEVENNIFKNHCDGFD